MSIFQAIALGAVQGLTEFFPVSSSGHLALTFNILGVEPSLSFSVFLHLATLIPVLTVFRKEVFLALKDKDKLLNLIIVTLPAGVVGLLFSDLVEGFFESIDLLAWSFFATALCLILSHFIFKSRKNRIKKGNALVYGLFQAVAVIPGVSRSGSLLTAGKILGVEDSENTAFVFLASVPIIISSAVLEGVNCVTSGVSIELLPTAVGFLSATCFGFVSTLFMKKLSKNSAIYFGVYLCLLSLIISVL